MIRALTIACLLLATPAGAQELFSTSSLAYSLAHPPILIESDYGHPVTIESQVIACNKPGQTAIRVIFPDSPSVAVLTITGTPGVHILPGCWRGFWGTNVWNARIDHFVVWGSPQDPMDAGIVLDGRSNDAVITAYHSFYTGVALWVVGNTEGTHISDSAMIQTNYGILVNTNDSVGRPGFWGSDNHIAAYYRGIVLANHEQSFLSGHLIYRVPRPGQTVADPNFVGIEVDSTARDTQLFGNLIMCGARTSTTRDVVNHGVRTWISQPPGLYCGQGPAPNVSVPAETDNTDIHEDTGCTTPKPGPIAGITWQCVGGGWSPKR